MEAVIPVQLKSGDWTTAHVPTWQRWLSDYAGRDGILALEVGVCAGQTSEWLCQHVLTAKGCTLDCVDHWRQYIDGEKAFDARAERLPQIRKFKGYSDAILPQLKTEGNRYSVIYVDGCHHAEAVLFDLVLSWSMLCKGGILFADDYELSRRNIRLPPRLAIDGWLACIGDSMTGYEISKCGQVAAWKRA